MSIFIVPMAEQHGSRDDVVVASRFYCVMSATLHKVRILVVGRGYLQTADLLWKTARAFIFVFM